MLSSNVEVVFFTNFMVLLAVAAAFYLFYHRNHEQMFLYWCIAGFFGAVIYFMASLGYQDPANPVLQPLILLAGIFLIIGCIAFWWRPMPAITWLLLLIVPGWTVISHLFSWSIFAQTSLPAVLLVIGYLLLALCFWQRQQGHHPGATVTFLVAVIIGAGMMSALPWLGDGFHPVFFVCVQLVNLLMVFALLTILLGDQEAVAFRIQETKEGALRRALRSRHRVVELNDRVGLLLRQVSDGIIVCDAHQVVISFNRAAGRIFGYDQSEMIGSSCEKLVTAETWEKMFSQESREETGSNTSHEEMEGVHRSGMVLSLDISISDLHIGDHVQHMIIIRDISERKKQEDRLNFFATHDALTGIYNRHHFEQRFERMLKQSGRGWMIFLDLDDFKMINDALGHQAGDTALVAVSKRLQSVLGEDALIARYSGDEFVMFIPAGDNSDDQEARLMDNLDQLLHQPVVSAGVEFAISGSLGVVRVPEHGKTVQTLLRNADLAMYEAKQQGKNKYAFYHPGLLQAVGRKADLATRLKSLVPSEQLSVYFQPRVGLPDRNLCGAEALLRWRTPEGEQISPEQFIPVAEETGQILRVGYWVMEQACRWLADWSDFQDPFVISINLSPKQLFDERLVDHIESLRTHYGLAAPQIEFEITEGAAIQNLQQAMKVLSRLRALGYSLSLDDFGTGFSSLSQLRYLPVDVLKIDKSFVRNMANDRHDRVMVAAIIEMAAHLDLAVLAEGVETADEFNLLDALGCNEIQGYLVSKPVPPETFADNILVNWNSYSNAVAWS